MATSFNVNVADLTYILKQITLAETTSIAYTAAPKSILQAIMDTYGATAANAAQLPFGLRTVDGDFNNLTQRVGASTIGAADTLFPRLTDPVFRTVDGPGIDFNGDGIIDVLNHNYGDASSATGTQIKSVVDGSLRVITNLIVDMSVDNPAAIESFLNNPLSVEAFQAQMGYAPTAVWFKNPVNVVAGNEWLQTIPNQSPDIGLSPGFNSWMTYFGQFFDHGLDLVTKGANGTVYIPLLSDDPLYDKGKDGIANNVVDAFFVTDPALAPVGGPLPAVSGTSTAWQAFYVTDPADRSLYAPGAFAPVITDVPTAFAVKFNDDGFGADGLVGTVDDRPNFMALTRATATIDANGVPQHENTTTSWIDQNQTYTSNESHQVFLRAYVREGGSTYATGKLLGGSAAGNSVAGAIGNWGEVKAQAITALGLKLSDFDVNDVPLVVADQYGKFIAGANGYAKVAVNVTIVDAVTGALISAAGPTYVEGKDGGLDIHALVSADLSASFTAGHPLAAGQAYKVAVIGTHHAFLNDIAHHAAPGKFDADGDGYKESFQTADLDIRDVDGDGKITAVDIAANNPDVNGDGTANAADLVADDGVAGTYDDEMLNAHFITGDGRGNENIALTTVHSIFHSEHDRLVDANKATILDSGDLAFINQWLRTDIASLADIDTPGEKAALIANLSAWDGERLFQAARFVTEMQYQHLVFEEFARRMQPAVNPFVFNNSPEINPSIVAEFAHTVYRFGHSMLTGTVDRLENDLTTVNGDLNQKTLLAVFLNPQQYLASGEDLATINANIIRGLSRDVGNEIDELIVTNVRSQLLGLPLDLAVLNLARGRETGIPSLNETRRQLYIDSGLADLKPYASWVDFANHIKNPASLVNFVAAYGTHSTITSATTVAAKRLAAEELVLGIDGADAGTDIAGGLGDRLEFLGGTGIYAIDLGGLNLVDLWIGGLAEAKNEFGGMLGSTFNYVFEAQMENLQNGDRMYYLTRTQGTNLLMNLEPNTFSDLVMRNTALGDKYATHLNGALFTTPDHILELDKKIAQENYGPKEYNGTDPGSDPDWAPGEPHSLLASKVTRDYTTAVRGVTPTEGVDGHNIGGTIRYSGGEHVVLGGTEGNDALYGDRGIDTLWGDAGNDYLNGGTESDDVFGGEGDDIIEDPFGDNVLRGNQGNDVISAARGFNLLFGDEGSDFIKLGQDASEVFAGEGNDFILGGAGGDVMLGTEGDDWMEGGAGFDGMDGDNSELFFNSPIIGHDVMFGQSDETDYEGESGDDIMGSGASVFRYGGQAGFDWAIGKGENQGVNFDMNIGLVATVPNDILRDRFDLVEAASGAGFDDQIIGDNRGSVVVALDPLLNFADHVLTQAGINRITGLNDWLGGARNSLLFGGPTFDPTIFRDGNILMGGDGNDTLAGRGGFDILDGDAYLNVRIRIVQNGVTYSAESLNPDTTQMGPNAGKVFNTNADGSPNFASVAFGGAFLQSLLINGTINPGDMSIVREILYDTTNVTGAGKNIDTAVFQGNRAEYDIEGLAATTQAGDNVLSYSGFAQDIDGDGFIRVSDKDLGTGVTFFQLVGGAATLVTNTRRVDAFGKIAIDDTDLVKNIEQLKFADGIFTVTGPPLLMPQVTLDMNGPGAGTNFSGSFTENGAAIAISSAPAISSGGTTISSAQIVLTDFQAGDVLSIAGLLPAGIVAAPVVSGAGTLTLNLSGLAGVAAYQTALGQVRYQNTSDAPGDALRTIAVTVTDATSTSSPSQSLITVIAVNDAPIAVADTILTNSTAALVLPEFALLANDTDIDGPLPLDITAVSASVGLTGLSLATNPGSITLTDTGGPGGTFSYTANDGSGAANATALGNVTVVNQAFTNVGDNFNGNGAVRSAANNSTGATAWAANSWIETGDDANIRLGQIQIDGGNGGNGTNVLRFFDTGDGASIQRTIALANTSNARISYTVVETGFTAGETVLVEFSDDGTFSTGHLQLVQTITSTTNNAGNITNLALAGSYTNGAAIRFTVSSGNATPNTFVSIDNLTISYANNAATINGTAAGEVLAGNDFGTILNPGAGNDRVFAGGGDDIINQTAATGGRDFIDGGANNGSGDRVVINGDGTVENYIVYTAAAAGLANITGLNVNTEIVITRNGIVIAELDNVEEITINTGPGADTVTAVGDFTPTQLFYNTITVNGDRSDTIDGSGITSAHQLVLNTGGSTVPSAPTVVAAASPAAVPHFGIGGFSGWSGGIDFSGLAAYVQAHLPSNAVGVLGTSQSGRIVDHGVSAAGSQGIPQLGAGTFDHHAPAPDAAAMSGFPWGHTFNFNYDWHINIF